MRSSSTFLLALLGLCACAIGTDLGYEGVKLERYVEKEPALIGASDGLQKRMEIAKAHLNGHIVRPLPLPKVPKVVHGKRDGYPLLQRSTDDKLLDFLADSEAGAGLNLARGSNHRPQPKSSSVGLGFVIVILALGGISALRMRISGPLLWIKRQRLWKSLQKYEPECRKPSINNTQTNTSHAEKNKVYYGGAPDAQEGVVIHRTQGSQSKLLGLIHSDIEEGVLDRE